MLKIICIYVQIYLLMRHISKEKKRKGVDFLFFLKWDKTEKKLWRDESERQN